MSREPWLEFSQEGSPLCVESLGQSLAKALRTVERALARVQPKLSTLHVQRALARVQPRLSALCTEPWLEFSQSSPHCVESLGQSLAKALDISCVESLGQSLAKALDTAFVESLGQSLAKAVYTVQRALARVQPRLSALYRALARVQPRLSALQRALARVQPRLSALQRALARAQPRLSALQRALVERIYKTLLCENNLLIFSQFIYC